MARDEAIARAFSEHLIPPTLRFYSWATPALTLGAFQTLEPEWVAALHANKIPCIRRITGGRALLHDQELTYSVVAGTEDPRFLGGIRQTFLTIANGLVTGLKKIGLTAKVHIPSRGATGGGRTGHPNRFCFASTSGHEITVSGRKLIGSAQKRWSHHFLQQGSLILNRGEERISALFSPEHMITLSEILSPLPDDATLRNALRQGMEDALQMDSFPGGLIAEEREWASQLVDEKYRSEKWNQYRYCNDRR